MCQTSDTLELHMLSERNLHQDQRTMTAEDSRETAFGLVSGSTSSKTNRFPKRNHTLNLTAHKALKTDESHASRTIDATHQNFDLVAHFSQRNKDQKAAQSFLT